jgi:hypothetical protein
MQWIIAHQAVIVSSGLFICSEILGAIPSVASNGVFQAVFSVFKKLSGK